MDDGGMMDLEPSEDLTGATSLGGNWILEDQTGHIDSALAVSAAMQSQYTGVLLQATPSTKGTGIWTESGFTTPQQGTWDGLTQGSQSNTAVSTTWTTVTSAESPTRNEAIVVGVDTNGVVRGERWDGTQWNALPTNPLSTVSSGVRQSFAVAYEQKTGNAMLVWDDGTALSYSVYNGTSWSTAATVSAPGTGGATVTPASAGEDGLSFGSPLGQELRDFLLGLGQGGERAGVA